MEPEKIQEFMEEIYTEVAGGRIDSALVMA